MRTPLTSQSHPAYGAIPGCTLTGSLPLSRCLSLAGVDRMLCEAQRSGTRPVLAPSGRTCVAMRRCAPLVTRATRLAKQDSVAEWLRSRTSRMQIDGQMVSFHRRPDPVSAGTHDARSSINNA